MFVRSGRDPLGLGFGRVLGGHLVELVPLVHSSAVRCQMCAVAGELGVVVGL